MPMHKQAAVIIFAIQQLRIKVAAHIMRIAPQANIQGFKVTQY